MSPVIHFDYDFSPYGQKTKQILAAAGVDFKKCDQPAVLPRKDLEALGITYRRIPLLAVGKDIYIDTHKIIEVIVEKLAPGKLTTSIADSAFEVWGSSTFAEVIGLVSPEVFTPDFKKDRETVDFQLLKRSDLTSLRPSAIASFRQRLRQVEDEFLSRGGPFINGDQISLADLHIGWVVRWALVQVGAQTEKELSKEEFPKVYKFIESLPLYEPSVLSAEDTHMAIRGAEYTASGPTSVKEGEAYGLAAGTIVHVEAFDTTPGAHPQAGKLIGTDDKEIVIEIDDGVRLHFPKIGYIVRSQQDAPKA